MSSLNFQIVFHKEPDNKETDNKEPDNKEPDNKEPDELMGYFDLGYFMRKYSISRKKFELVSSDPEVRIRQDRVRDKHRFFCVFCRNRHGGIECYPARKNKALKKQVKKHPKSWMFE